MHSVQKMLLFIIWSSSLEIVEISSHALIAKVTPIFFCHEEGVREQVPDFLPSNTSCSENLLLHIRKTRYHHRKTQTVHHIHSEETNYKNVFLQPENVFSKHELLMSYRAAVVTCLRLFIQTFSKHSSPELRNFLQHFPANSYLKCGMFEIKTLFNNVSESRHYITDGQKCIYQQ